MQVMMTLAIALAVIAASDPASDDGDCVTNSNKVYQNHHMTMYMFTNALISIGLDSSDQQHRCLTVLLEYIAHSDLYLQPTFGWAWYALGYA